MQPTILIADENVNAQIITGTLLQLRGYAVRCVGDGTEACEVLDNEDIAVVVVDLDLPCLNGFELLRRLNGRLEPTPRPRHPPGTVVLAQDAKAETERFVRHLGADAFLRKPVAPRRLIDTVEHLMIERRVRSAQSLDSQRYAELFWDEA